MAEMTLIDKFYTIAMDNTIPFKNQVSAARTVMPYLYRKMPISTEVTVNGSDAVIQALDDVYKQKPKEIDSSLETMPSSCGKFKFVENKRFPGNWTRVPIENQ